MTDKQIKNITALLKGESVSKINMTLGLYREPDRVKIAEYLGCPVNNIAVVLSQMSK